MGTRQKKAPAPEKLISTAPEHLQPVVREIWDELAPKLNVPDEARAGFEVLCFMMAEFRAGQMTATRMMVLRGLLNDFGMTTAARERLGSKAPPAEDDFASFLAGR